MKKLTIELNDLFKRALDLMENSRKNAFITGKAGTGKSTLLDYFRNHTKKKVVVLAPTGVAAINVKGETIHSFFRFKPDITLAKVKKINLKKNKKSIYKEIDAIVIDEISMVRADLLDCVDLFLRLNGPNKNLPFGGLQIIFIGDLYQLPPVVVSKEKHLFRGHYQSEYFFSSHVFEHLAMEYLELEKVYRQKDQAFIGLLNTVRNNSAGEKELVLLNKRCDPKFEPSKESYYIYLTTTNKMAAEVNEKQLNRLKGKLCTIHGRIAGDFDKKRLPTDLELKLKNGSQIMLLNNDFLGRWVNGTVGRIVKIRPEEIIVELADGSIEEVEPYQWEIFHFKLNQRGLLESEVVGKFKQFPLKLAWAITIHKSQGKTFDSVIIDIGNGTFAHGQMYVALSRCRSLEGIVLKKPIKKSHIFMDYRVVKFVTKYQYRLSEKDCSLENKIGIISDAIKNKSHLEIVYLKAQDVKSKRTIQPKVVEKMEYLGKKFLGVRAYCLKRKEERVFRVDRILSLLALPYNI